MSVLPDLDEALRCGSNVIVKSEEEHEHEEEAETSKEMPEVMIVVEVEKDTLMVECLWFGRACVGIFDLVVKEDAGSSKKAKGQSEEDDTGVGGSLSNVELHADVESKVEQEVCDKDVEEDTGVVSNPDDHHTEHSVDDQEDPEEDKPKQNFLDKWKEHNKKNPFQIFKWLALKGITSACFCVLSVLCFECFWVFVCFVCVFVCFWVFLSVSWVFECFVFWVFECFECDPTLKGT